MNLIYTEDKLSAVYCLLNAFCSVATSRNVDGASRFLNIFLLEFNRAGQLASLLLQLVALDQTRLIYQPNDESNFLIFYYLVFGCSEETVRNEFLLDEECLHRLQAKQNLLFKSGVDKAHAGAYAKKFQQVLDAFKVS